MRIGMAADRARDFVISSSLVVLVYQPFDQLYRSVLYQKSTKKNRSKPAFYRYCDFPNIFYLACKWLI